MVHYYYPIKNNMFCKFDVLFDYKLVFPSYVCVLTQLQEPTELWKKKRFNLQAPPVYDRKVTNLFFSIIIFSIIIFFP